MGPKKGLPFHIRQDTNKHTARCAIKEYRTRFQFAIHESRASISDANWWCKGKALAVPVSASSLADGLFRVICLPALADRILVLHAFQKKT